jgi:hypothetical protein
VRGADDVQNLFTLVFKTLLYCTLAKLASVSEQHAVFTVHHADARIMCIRVPVANTQGGDV